jgi:hypothetical protein
MAKNSIESSSPGTAALRWWMRVVGAFYLLKFVVVAFVKGPIRGQAPEALGLAATGDHVARFLVDTWVIFGLEMAALGAALVIASSTPYRARALAFAIIGVEISGITADVYQVARGHAWTIPGVWVAIHALIIVAGLLSLRSSRMPSSSAVAAA